MRAFRFCFPLLTVALVLPAQDVKEFEKKVTEFTLTNGLHFILVERHEAPVIAFHTYVNAGSVNDPSGQTGISHLFEHLAFKGTETIGTRNWADEKKALDAVEEVYDRLDAERNKGPRADQNSVEMLQTQVKLAVDRADLYARPDEYLRILDENGATALKAVAGVDSTEYSYSLPSNKIELWFLMESQRLLHPVFRQIYRERETMLEEYRQQVEGTPQGKVLQSLGSTAFVAHPYRQPMGGWSSDIMNLRRGDARAFFEKYYVPANMVIVLAGDVNGAEAKRLAEHYFGPMPAKPLPPVLHTLEPPQLGPKTALVISPTSPVAAVAYKRPDQYDKDDTVFDVIQFILTTTQTTTIPTGRSGLLHKEMVEEKRLSTSVQTAATFPNGRYPSLFLFMLAPAQGHSVDDNEKGLDDFLARFKARKVDAETLQRAKNQSRTGALGMLSANSGLARLLAVYYASYGDWRKVFASIDQMNGVTADDVQRVAQRYFVPVNRTFVYTAASTAPYITPQRPPATGGKQ